VKHVAVRLALTLAIAVAAIAAAVLAAPAPKPQSVLGAEPTSTGANPDPSLARKTTRANGIVPQHQHPAERLAELVGQGFKRTRKQ